MSALRYASVRFGCEGSSSQAPRHRSSSGEASPRPGSSVQWEAFFAGWFPHEFGWHDPRRDQLTCSTVTVRWKMPTKTVTNRWSERRAAGHGQATARPTPRHRTT